MLTTILETELTQEIRIQTINSYFTQENFTTMTTSKTIEENKLNVKLVDNESLKLTIEQIDKSNLIVLIGSDSDTIIHFS